MQNSNYNLLVIDDDVGVRQSFVAYLQDSDFKVFDAPDATSGLKLFEQFIPDLVITDLKMPGMHGLSLLKLLKERYPELPVIVISGAGVMNDVVEALRLGANDYLIKPVVDMEVLVYAITQSLERSKLVSENETYKVELERVNQALRGHIDSLELDQKAGHFVQQSMQPISPFSFQGYTVSHKVIPSLYLSGDCIDFNLFGRNHLAFYLADVSGHGSAPAFVTIWLKNLVNQIVNLSVTPNFKDMQTTLNELLTVLNDEIIDVKLNNHLTMIMGAIDIKSNNMFYVVCGHLPLPILMTSTGVEYLPGKGKPLGLFANNDWHVNHIDLPDEFSLMFFSDGILELIEGKDLIEKEKNLLKLLGSLDDLSDLIESTLSSLDLSHSPDDIACLSIAKSV